MNDAPERATTWRLFEPSDLVFAYDLAIIHGPRWWNVTRHGTSPEATMNSLSSYAAGVTILHEQTPIGIATLSETGSAGTGMFEVRAVDAPALRDSVSDLVPVLIASVFAMSDVRILYHSRFDGDPELRGRSLPLWRDEVRFPEYAFIAGRYEDLIQSALRRSDFESSNVFSSLGTA